MNKKDEFYNSQTKEQLIIFLHNHEYQIESLRQRLERLTGCREFGNLDGMNGACVDCSYTTPELFEKCWNFHFNKREIKDENK